MRHGIVKEIIIEVDTEIITAEDMITIDKETKIIENLEISTDMKMREIEKTEDTILIEREEYKKTDLECQEWKMKMDAAITLQHAWYTQTLDNTHL